MTATLRCTRDQLLAAEAAYNRVAAEHAFPPAMLVPLEPAVDAALALLKHPWKVGQEEAPAGMDRATALAEAQKMVDHLSTAPTKANGYVVDGWKAPTLEERTTQVLRLAAFLSGTAGEV